MKRNTRLGAATTMAACMLAASPSEAQQSSDAAAIARLEAMIKAQDARIQELERQLGAQPLQQAAVAQPPEPASKPVEAAQVAASTSPFTISGDFRVRAEGNFYESGAPDRLRKVVRARLRAKYVVTDWLTAGAQLSTGDPGDPNTTDVTLSNFVDDLQVSLDQAYLTIVKDGLEVYAGKFPLPFTSTEMVWDGDVAPQGAAAAYTFTLGGHSLRAAGIYSILNEVAAGDDSRMVGGQLRFDTGAIGDWKGDASIAYYDYDLPSVAGADAGDFRGNRIALGRYVSDFDLTDVVAGVTWSGLGAAWPVRAVVDYVRNSGAADNNDGYWIDLKVGAGTAAYPWRFGYGYAEVEMDAVLAAFSHDNLDLSTNYRQHVLVADYALSKNVSLNATYYHYQSLEVVPGAPQDWADRVRLNLLASF